jgi:hypothetical protein
MIPERVITYNDYNNPKTGIRFIDFARQPKFQIWEISAKLLGKSYKDLIYSGNIDMVIGKINSSGILKVKPVEFMDSVVVISADITRDIPCQDVSEVLDALSVCAISKNYTRTLYEHGGIKETVLFSRKSKPKRSVSFYDKQKELKLPKNKSLRALIYPDTFKGILRMECRFKHIDEFRDVFGPLGKNKFPYLKDLLCHSANPYVHRFAEILDSKVSNALIPADSNIGIFDVFRLLGSRSKQKDFCFLLLLYQSFNYDIDQLKAYLRTNSKYYYRDDYMLKQYIAYLYLVTSKSTLHIISSLMDKLK